MWFTLSLQFELSSKEKNDKKSILGAIHKTPPHPQVMIKCMQSFIIVGIKNPCSDAVSTFM